MHKMTVGEDFGNCALPLYLSVWRQMLLARGGTVSVKRFYDELAPFYHLIFPDWEASIRRQAEALDGVIRERWGDGHLSILDAACGIGTQALGLATLGHRVTASDISDAELERAAREARDRGLAIHFS